MPEREKTPEERRIELVEGLKRCRDEYRDEIPDEITNSTTDQTHKATKSWMMHILGRLDLAMHYGLLSESIQPEAEEFCEKFSSPDFALRPTTEKDIAEGHEMIEKVLAELKPEG